MVDAAEPFHACGSKHSEPVILQKSAAFAFFVWNRNWKRLILDGSDLSLSAERELLAVKLRWTFRK